MTQNSAAGADVCVAIRVSLAEATEGASREVEYQRFEGCAACDGYGAAREHREDCRACGGSGTNSEPPGSLRCDSCQGTGFAIHRPCPHCDGVGGGTRPAKASVAIPAGIQTGMQLRLPGMGHALRRGLEAGALYLEVAVAPQSDFAREGDDLFTLVQVPRDVADRGGDITVCLPGGSAKLEVQAGTRTGDDKRWTGLGGLRLGAPASRSTRDKPARIKASGSRGDLITCFVLEGDAVPPSATLRLQGRGHADVPSTRPVPRSDSVSPLFITLTALVVLASIVLVTWLRM